MMLLKLMIGRLDSEQLKALWWGVAVLAVRLLDTIRLWQNSVYLCSRAQRGLGAWGLAPIKTNFCKIQKRSFYPREYPIRGP
jgi:hypothetical protein